MGKFVCIHGHFYQPPRENPWLEAVEVQDSAAPFHDWNQRVTAECYAPNAAARVLNPAGKIENIVNNYQRVSFNFGPTLLDWMARETPEVVAALTEADRLSLERWGHGSAMAQVYNHLIMPLATRRDKLTQIRWGLRDFQHHFGRPAEGMWLAETAVNMESLELMAAEGIKFTILAPHQAQAVRPPEGGDWLAVGTEGVDGSQVYRVATPAGDIAVFFYQGTMSRAVAFEGLLDDGARFAQRIKESLPDSDDSLLMLATDGESYGHHHRFGEMALAFALSRLEQDPEVELINPAAFLEGHPPQWEAKIVEDSSWSCPHGVERWRSDCGCALDPGRGWSQAWRTPLRQAVDHLLERLGGLLESEGGALLNDPWAARDDYVDLILDESQQAREKFLREHQARDLSHEQQVRVLKLMESQRWGLFAATSCAWFFDDLAGIEAVQNLRFAARALQLAGELDGGGWEEEVSGILAEGRSNLAVEGDGADIWRRRVAPAKVGPRRVAAHAAISGVMGEEPPPEELFVYDLIPSAHRHRSNLGLDLSWGKLTVTHRRLGQPHQLIYAALHPGGHEFLAQVGYDPGDWDPASLEQPVEPLLRMLDQKGLKDLLAKSLGGEAFTLGDLFLEGRRSLAQEMLTRTLTSEFDLARNLYDTHRDTMRFLQEINVPRPKLFEALASAVLAGELIQLLTGDSRTLSPERLGEIVSQVRELGLDLEGPRVNRAVEEALSAEVATLADDPGNDQALERAGAILDLTDALELEPNLWKAQNIVFGLAQRLGRENLDQALAALGRRLNLDL